MTKQIILALFSLILANYIFGQEADSLNAQAPDSLITDTRATEKTSVITPWIWYDIRGISKEYSKRSPYQFHKYDDFQVNNLTGLGDYFLNHNRYFLYDFIGTAMPRYISETNLLPHQTGVRLNGILLNDPINGMVNIRDISPDIIRFIEQDEHPVPQAASISTLSDGLNLSRFLLHPKEPLTRLKYTEGDFSYTDLDITFAKPVNKNLAIELGGYNRDYAPTGLRSANYRTSVYKKWNSGIQYALHFQKNQINTFFDDFNSNDSYRYRNLKHYLHNDLTVWLGDSTRERWHLDLVYKHDRRTIDAVTDTSLRSRFRHYQYQFNIDRNKQIGSNELYANLFAAQEVVWGNRFDKKYNDTRIGGRVYLEMPGEKSFRFNPSLGYLWKTDESLQFLPALDLHLGLDKIVLRSNLYQTARYPTRLEKNVSLIDLQGNQNLKTERLANISFQIKYMPVKILSFKTDLIWRSVENEILFTEGKFYNKKSRSFTQLRAEADWSVWKLWLKTGGQITDSEINITPKSSFWLQGNYHDRWIYSRIHVNLSGGLRWHGPANTIYYHQGLERFYWDNNRRDSYYTLFYKFAAKVKDAVLFFEMDNALSSEYAIIKGYTEYIRRIRLGVNWKMWD